MRYAYGARQRILHERSAMMNGLSLMWSEKAKPMDYECFLWTGNTADGEMVSKSLDGDRPQDHVVNILAANIDKAGKLNYEEMVERAKQLLSKVKEK